MTHLENIILLLFAFELKHLICSYILDNLKGNLVYVYVAVNTLVTVIISVIYMWPKLSQYNFILVCSICLYLYSFQYWISGIISHQARKNMLANNLINSIHHITNYMIIYYLVQIYPHLTSS